MPLQPDDPVLALEVFDATWYLFRYPEVHGFEPHPLSHFRRFGFAEGRDPSPHISLAKFYSSYPEARGATLDMVMRQIAGLSREDQETIRPDDPVSFEYLLSHHRMFDEAWYAARYPDLTKVGPGLIKHFVAHGAIEDREPSLRFDPAYYRAAYPQFVERSRSAIEDYLRIGVRRGYAPTGAPRYQRWISAFDTLTADDLSWLQQQAIARPYATLAIHIIDAAACRQRARIISAWTDRVDRACAVWFLRGADVQDDAWQAFAAAAGKGSGLVVHVGRDVSMDLPVAGFIVLVSGATQVRQHATVALTTLLHATGQGAAYADHDHADADGTRTSPRFKPDMSPEFMRRRPYAGKLIAVAMRGEARAQVTQALAAAQAGEAERAFAHVLIASGRQDVAHTPFILYHDLDAPGASPAANAAETPKVIPDGRAQPRVSIIVPTRNHGALLRACLESLTHDTDYPADLIDIIVVDNDSDEADTLAYFADLRQRPKVQVAAAPGAFNYSVICNLGAALAQGDVLVFLNNDMSVNRRDWLSQLVAQASCPDVGVVGAQLLYPDGGVQHGGVVLGIQGVGAHRLSDADVGPAGAIDVTREMVAVTGACLAVRRTIFESLGGFDPVLRVAFNDVKLCIASHEAGLRNIYIGEPLLFHHESKSRGFDDTLTKRHRNARESIYVRRRHERPFRSDPFYSPNLSLQSVDRLATPPRVIPPWRRGLPDRRRALLLSFHHGIGYGVAVVQQQQAAYLLERGWDVIVGGPLRSEEVDYSGCRRVDLWTAEAAAAYAVSAGMDAVIAHTDPFFSTARFFGVSPLLYVFDHGEPPPHFFADLREREALDWEKRFCAPMAQRVFTISETIKAAQFRDDAVVLRNGNSHLARWSPAWKERRRAVRAQLGLDGRFVVLNVCRFGAKDRLYKGVDRYAEVASDLPFLHPDLADRAHFILAGRGDPLDVAEMRATGIDVHANPADADLIDLYAASDFYLSFSQWEGYNLGIGQALAMGLDAIGSDISAHREFAIKTSNSIHEICNWLATSHASWDESASDRQAFVQPWTIPLETMVDLIEADLSAA